MNEIFLKVLNMSITASFVIVVVVIIRLFLRKVPKVFTYMLWWVVLFRLLCPISIESVWSFIPINQQVIPMAIEQMERPEIDSNIEEVDHVVNEMLFAQSAPNEINSSNPMQIVVEIAKTFWLLGIALLLGYRIESLWKVRNITKSASCLRENIYLVEGLATPFVLGILQPRIYLPVGLKEEEREYILLHEQMHVKRRDTLVKGIGYFALSIHWFNPLVWIAFSLLSRDIEMSCDEAVLDKMGDGAKKPYSELLLRFTVENTERNASWITFGKGEVKERIKNILQYKKLRNGMLLGLVTLLIVVAAGLLLNPQSNNRGLSQYANYLNQWAQAFCDRDADTIAALSSSEVTAYLEKEKLLTKGENSYAFGWSSPWPMQLTEQYKNNRIVSYDEKEAKLLYYAFVSDPHITVWEERITYHLKGEAFQVTSEEITYFDEIATKEEFDRAYPNGTIANTMMDYQTNGLGELLNQNANRSEYQYYHSLLEPETALCSLLNLSKEKTRVQTMNFDREKGVAEVEITFLKDDSKIKMAMIQPYGADGIWVPQDSL